MSQISMGPSSRISTTPPHSLFSGRQIQTAADSQHHKQLPYGSSVLLNTRRQVPRHTRYSTCRRRNPVLPGLWTPATMKGTCDYLDRRKCTMHCLMLQIFLLIMIRSSRSICCTERLAKPSRALHGMCVYRVERSSQPSLVQDALLLFQNCQLVLYPHSPPELLHKHRIGQCTVSKKHPLRGPGSLFCSLQLPILVSKVRQQGS